MVTPAIRAASSWPGCVELERRIAALESDKRALEKRIAELEKAFIEFAHSLGVRAGLASLEAKPHDRR